MSQLDNYKAAYEQAMAQQGVKVTWNEDGVPGGVPSVGGYNNPDNWVATLSRDGVSVDTLVTLGRIQVTGMSPEQLAQQDIQFALKFTGQINSPQGNVPSPFFDPVDDETRRFYEVNPHLKPGYVAPVPNTRAGPGTTVPTGSGSSQTLQSPPAPNDGTVVRPPTTSSSPPPPPPATRLTFWQWNYYYQLATQRVGPDPAAVGVASGTQLMTGAEWVAAVGNYYGGPISVPPTDGTGATGVGSTPTTPSIPVGGTGAGTGSNPPVGDGAPPAGGGGDPGPVRHSFWEWNALKEQSTGIVGDDPSHYGIQGSDLMTLADWSSITAAYYASKQTPGATKPVDNTVLYLAVAAVLLVVVMGKRG